MRYNKRRDKIVVGGIMVKTIQGKIIYPESSLFDRRTPI